MKVCKSRLLLIVLVVVCLFTNCAPPIGSLWESEFRMPADNLWALPLRTFFGTDSLDNAFRPSTDLLVFIANEGITFNIPVEEVCVQLSEDVLSYSPSFTTIINGNGNGNNNNNNGNGVFRFTRAGRYLVRVYYNGIHSDPFSIQVGGVGGDRPPGGGGADEGILIVWRPLVTFDTDGGSPVPRQRLDYGALLTRPADPTKTDYDFAGWYKDRLFAIPFNFDTPVYQSITLFAKWDPP